MRGPTDPEYTRTLAATLRLRPQRGGAPHHRPALPLGPAGLGPAHPRARRHGRAAAPVRRGALGRAGARAPRHQHVHRSHAAQADRRAARRRPRARRPVLDALARRQRGSGAVRAQAGGDRAVRRRLPLRDLRLHRAGRRRRAPARGAAGPARARAARRCRASSCGWSTPRARSCPPGSRACSRSAPATTFSGYHGRERLARRLEVRRRHRPPRRRRLRLHPRPPRRPRHHRRDERLPGRGRSRAARAPRRARRRRLRAAVGGVGRDRARRRRSPRRPRTGRRRAGGARRAAARRATSGPRSWQVRAALPRTDSGKLLKRLLRAEHGTSG